MSGSSRGRARRSGLASDARPRRMREQTPRTASAVAQPSRRPARAIRPLFRTGFEHGSRGRIDSHLRDAPLSATGPRRPPVWRCCPGRSSRPSRVELHGGRPANPTARVLAGSRRTAGGALAPGGQAGAFGAVDLAARTRHARGAVRPPREPGPDAAQVIGRRGRCPRPAAVNRCG